MKPGDTVWVLDEDPRRQEIQQATVETVGRKYFTLTSRYGVKFSRETLLEVKDWGGPDRVFLRIEDYNAFVRKGKLESALRKEFGSYGETRLNLEQLDRIAEVIGLVI